MLGLDLHQLKAERFREYIGEHGDTVIFALAITHNDLMVGEVKILDPQAHYFHQTEPTAIHDLGHELVYAVHFRDHSLSLIF
jgi:hypothetical protein